MWYARLPSDEEVEERNVLSSSVHSNDREFEEVDLNQREVHAVRAADNQYVDQLLPANGGEAQYDFSEFENQPTASGTVSVNKTRQQPGLNTNNDQALG